MTGHRIGGLRQHLRTSREDPELQRRRRAVQDLELVDPVQALTAVREARGVTQVEVAHAWETAQSNVSRFEHTQDTYLSTPLGGRLELRVVCHDQVVDLTPHEEAPAPATRKRARGSVGRLSRP